MLANEFSKGVQTGVTGERSRRKEVVIRCSSRRRLLPTPDWTT